MFLITVLVIALAVVVPTLNTYISQRQQLIALQQQVAQQEASVEQLQQDVDRWEDPTFVAAQARERLLFAMPGETQYRLTDTSGKDVPLTEQEQTAQEAAQGDWFSMMWESVEGASRLSPEDIPDPAPEEGDGEGASDAPADDPAAEPSGGASSAPAADPTSEQDTE
ncbi:septum formation initiator [Brachybacterium phenoliresistens]|uniref:Septum formation initiator n=1 Tax=Brachybacterium phenoliresistens TaxID=396014 RepID=Z9JRU9_9MICO|nr:septum formation initiator [Brachybacterium phenoliresistens]